MKSTKSVKIIAEASLIAALYIILTYISIPISNGILQIRIAEALCVLPAFSVAAIPGLTVGCFIADILTEGSFLSAVIGTTATLVAALIARRMSLKIKNSTVLCKVISLPNVVANTIAVPLIFKFVFCQNQSVYFFIMIVLVGEIISSTILGYFLTLFLNKYKKYLFK